MVTTMNSSRRRVIVAVSVLALTWPAATRGEPATSKTFPAIADAYVREDQPSTTFGTTSTLLARFDPASIIYFKFDAGTSGGASVLSAHLRLTVSESSIASGGVISRVGSSSWSESSLTWSNKPVVDGVWADVLGGVTSGQVADFEVTSAFDDGSGARMPSGAFTLAVQSGAQDAVTYRSRHHTTGTPQLVVTLSTAAPVPAPVHITRGPYVQKVTGTSAVIAWSTARPGSSTVRYGTGGTLDRTATGASTTAHAVPLTGLTPGAAVSYAIDNNGMLLTPVASFRAAPGPGASFTFAAFGDSGFGSPEQLALASRIATVRPDLVLHLGDLVYPSSARISWDPYFFIPYEATLARAPSFATFGNHESYSESGRPYFDNLSLPVNSSTGTERYYSFDYGDVHFASLNTQDSLGVGTPQYNWLASDLAATSKTWKIVFMHRPMYSSTPGHESDLEIRQSLAPLFVQRGVQLVLAGHAHDYERTFPQNGVTYVVSGGGGRSLYPNATSSFTAYSASVFHITAVSVSPTTISLQAMRADGTVFDAWSKTLSPPPESLVVDDAFNRVVSNGWGSTGGLAWAITTTFAGNYSVDGAAGRIIESTTGSRYGLLAIGARDTSTLMRFRFAAIPTTSWNAVYALARTAGTGRWYAARARSVAGAKDDIEFDRRTSAGLVRIGSTAGVPEFAAGVWYRLRLETTGDGVTTTLRARVWKDGTTEPSTWTVTTTDSSAALQVAGGVGVLVSAASSSQPGRADVDSFQTWLR